MALGPRQNGDVADRSALGLIPMRMRRDGKLLVGGTGDCFSLATPTALSFSTVGKLTLSDQQVEGWRALLHERADRLEEIGCTLPDGGCAECALGVPGGPPL